MLDVSMVFHFKGTSCFSMGAASHLLHTTPSYLPFQTQLSARVALRCNRRPILR
jgi:hypothetical protein